MNEEQLRLEYWEDTRSDPAYPLWVIFRLIGHEAGIHDDQPYLRATQTNAADVLKSVETHALMKSVAEDIGVSLDELRATLWYAIWKIEHTPPPEDDQQWNRRVDTAWRSGTLSAKGAANS